MKQDAGLDRRFAPAQGAYRSRPHQNRAFLIPPRAARARKKRGR